MKTKKTEMLPSSELISETRLPSGRRVPTIKQKEYIRQLIITKNGTEAASRAYNVAERTTAATIHNENIKRPYVIEEIKRICEAIGLDITSVLRIHKRNMVQQKNLSVSQTAVRDYYDIQGITKQHDNKPSVAIGLIIER